MSQKESRIDAEYMRKVLRYYPASGNFYWIDGQTKMQKAGYMMTIGRIGITVHGKSYYAHRLAWLYMTGEWPKHMIDHINGDPADNSFANLRDEPRITNTQNQKRRHKNNKSGYMGVVKDLRCRSDIYRASIHANGKTHQLGNFRNPQEAHEAYLAAKRRLHPGCTI